MNNDFNKIATICGFIQTANDSGVQKINDHFHLIYTIQDIPQAIRRNLGIGKNAVSIGIGSFSPALPVVGGSQIHPPLENLKDHNCWFRTSITISGKQQIFFPKSQSNPAESSRRDIWAHELFPTNSKMLEEFKKSFEIQSNRFQRSFDDWYKVCQILRSKERENCWGFGAPNSSIRKMLLEKSNTQSAKYPLSIIEKAKFEIFGLLRGLNL